jgi:RimJ/RimL family protein N-acetyltransferase
MIALERSHWPALRSWFQPERPGPQVGLHAIQTGRDGVAVDRWPDPRAVFAWSGANAGLGGDPAAFGPDDFPRDWAALVDAPPEFLPLLRRAAPEIASWDRIISELRAEPTYRVPRGASVRRLEPRDLPLVERLDPEVAWISDTLGGPAGLAASGFGWGAFVDGKLASVAASFFVGERYEDIGVVTERPFRGRGLVPACAGRLAEEIRARGRTPSWTTSPDNLASLRVAEKLGFERSRDDVLYVVGMPLPEPARPPGPTDAMHS